MAFQQQPGKGALFPNDKKEKETHPDFKGDINIEGKNYWIAAWRKQGKNGEFLSVSVDEKRAPDISSKVDGQPRKPTKGDDYRAKQGHKPSAPPLDDDFINDSIPF